ncbi:MAG: HEAT repeat domain-containing protein [Elusimicrobia bacterium]|nr:HEAT repeat domain-containing protein [Elusimicrobiota bacterium]
MKKISVSLFIIYIVVTSVCWGADIKGAISKLHNKETRQEAIKEIEKIGKPAVAHLRQLAKDKKKDQNSRISAIVLLGRMKAEEAGTDLEEVLEKDDNKFCREASAIALGKIKNKKAIPKLKKALKDESGNVRMRAVWALAKMGDKSGKKLALDIIKSKDVTAQLLAVEALEAIGDKDVIPELENNLNSNSVWTRIHSKLAIKRLKIQGLSEQEKLNFLKETLKDEQFEVNQWSAQELTKVGTPEAIGILKETAKDETISGSYSAKKVLMIMLKQGKITEEELQK